MKLYRTTSFYNQGIMKLIPHVLVVFGDNQQRIGYGGQAIIRDFPNAVGIATMRRCGEFMTGTLDDFDTVLRDIRNLEARIKLDAASVLFPITLAGDINIGTGIAALTRTAPHLYDMINGWYHSLPTPSRVKLPQPVQS